jgi:hypothetical protein
MSVTQTEFADALLDPERDPPAGLSGPRGGPVGKRFDIHRNTVVASLVEAMHLAFPITAKLLGDAFFNSMTAVYVRAHPPTSPVLMLYGKDFPDFLQKFEPVRHLPYLPDIAQLELARRHSYHSADTPAIDPEALTAIPPETLMDVKFKLSPMMHIIASPYPILSIWNDNTVTGGPKPGTASETVLVTRPEFDVEMQILTPPTHVFMMQLNANKPLGHAYDAAIKISNDFDLSQAIGLLLKQNIIVEITGQMDNRRP